MAQANIKAVITAEDKASGALKGFGNSVESAGKKGSKAFGAVKAGAVAAGAAIGFSIVKNFDNAVKRIDTLNNFPKVLMAMGASASDAKNATNKLAESLDGLPTPIDEAASGVQSLVAAGLSVSEATDAFLAMNNALLASGQSGEDTQIVMQSLQRAISAGSVDASTMQAALSRMPTVMQALSKETGKSAGELFKLYSQDPKKLIKDMVRLNKEGSGSMKSLEKQARDATDGIGTGIDNMNTAITRGIVKIIESVGRENVAGAIRSFGQVMEIALSAVAKAITLVIRGITNLTTFLANNKTAVMVVAGIITTLLLPALALWTANMVKIQVQAGITAIANALAATKSGIVWSLNAYKALGAWLLTFARMIARGAVAAAAMIAQAGRVGAAWILQSRLASNSVGSLRSLVSKKMVMGGIVITAALWALNNVMNAVIAIRDAIRDVNNAARASSAHTGSQSAAMGRLQHLMRHGTPAQQARARKAMSAQASGTDYAPGGMALVGERGPELVNLPRGSKVKTHDKTRQMMGGGHTTINISVPMMVGSANERRRVARMLIKDIQDVAAMNGKSPVDMLGSNYGLVT